MAFFNEIGAGRYNRLLQKLLNMKGGPPARQLMSDIGVFFPLFLGAEARFLEGWERYSAAATVAAGGAGNVSVVQLGNLATSNAIGVIEKISVSAGAADLILIRQALGIGDLTNLVTTVPLDSRSVRAAALRFSNKNNSVSQGAGSTIGLLSVPINQTLDFIITDIQEIPILPNTAYNVTANTPNEALNVTMVWRERALEDSEVKA